MAKYRTPADYRIYDLPRQADARRRANATGPSGTSCDIILRSITSAACSVSVL
jgi:hypothetical protein